MTELLQIQEVKGSSASQYQGMRLVTEEEYRRFVAEKKHVRIENVDVKIGAVENLDSLVPTLDNIGLWERQDGRVGLRVSVGPWISYKSWSRGRCAIP